MGKLYIKKIKIFRFGFLNLYIFEFEFNKIIFFIFEFIDSIIIEILMYLFV